jgi:ACS family glucarate transporter-like MFS transporter
MNDRLSGVGVKKSRSWAVLIGLLAPATLIMAMDRAVVTIAAPLLQTRYDLSLTQVGLLFTVFFWAYALMQMPAGALVERYGPRLCLFVAIILWSAMTALTPFAPAFGALLVFRIILGIGQSADWPASIVSINRLFSAGERATANSVLLCALYAGPVVGAPLTAWLLGWIGLEGVFIACGLIGAVFAAIWIIFYRDTSQTGVVKSKRTALIVLREVATSRRAWTLAAAYACTASFVSFYLSWFPTYLLKARAVSLAQMGMFSGVASLALCIAVLAGGRIIARLERRHHTLRRARVPVGVTALLAAGLSALFVPYAHSNIIAVVAASTSLAALGFSQVVTWSVVQDLGGTDTGPLTGLINLVGNIAAGASPLIAAQIVTRSGSWTGAFVALAIIALIGALLWLTIDPGRPLASAQSDELKLTVENNFARSL